MSQAYLPQHPGVSTLMYQNSITTNAAGGFVGASPLQSAYYGYSLDQNVQWNTFNAQYDWNPVLQQLQLHQGNAPMKSNNTIRVIESNGTHKDFDLDGEKANEEAALEYASERADATRASVRLLKPFAVVTPERKTKVTKL